MYHEKRGCYKVHWLRKLVITITELSLPEKWTNMKYNVVYVPFYIQNNNPTTSVTGIGTVTVTCEL